MGKGSSSSQSTQATQTTANSDYSSNASEGSSIIGGAGSTVTINDLSSEVAGKAIDLSSDVAGKAIDVSGNVAKAGFNLSKDTTSKAFEYLDSAGTLLTEYLQTQSRANNAAALQNQDLTANLAQRSFALADPVSAANDKVFSIGKTALYIGGSIAGLFLLIKLFKKPS